MATGIHRSMVWGGTALALLSALWSCGGDDVDGHWCGKVVDSDEQCLGDEVNFLELSQSGDDVTGAWCEEYRRDCYPLENGRLDGGNFTGRYTFGNDYIEASLTLDGDVLDGSIFASTCDCNIPTTLHRIP